MRTFDARLDSRVFWSAVLVPPLVFWIVVEGIVNHGFEGQVNLPAFLLLIVLAYGLPLAALAYTLCSVAAYTIAPGRLIVHRAVGDRVVPLAPASQVVRRDRTSVKVELEGGSVIVRADDVEACVRALRAASLSRA